MAVHTQLSRPEIESYLVPYNLGPVRSVEGVPEGSIHTTYRVVAGTGTFYLRLTEGLGPAAVRFELELLAHLGSEGLAVPGPRAAPGGAVLGTLRGRPAVVFSEVRGRPLTEPALTPAHAAAVGDWLARLHLASDTFGPTRDNPYAPEVVAGWLSELRARELRPDLAQALEPLAQALEGSRGFGSGPLVVCHADLFVDNVHWFGSGELAGVLDFEMACSAPVVLDLAIALLVWCWGEDGVDAGRARSLLAAYQEARPLGTQERASLFDACRFAAVRYAVSRIRDFHCSELPPDRLVRKDWRVFQQRLEWLESHGSGPIADLLG